jgi:hypothetical protein
MPTVREYLRCAYRATKGMVDDPTERRWAMWDGLYWFANDWHSGMGDPLYLILSRSPFTPARNAEGPEDEVAEYVYQELELKFSKLLK